MLRTALAVSVLIVAFDTAHAAEPTNFEVTPFVGYRMGGQIDTEDANLDIKLRDSNSFGVLFNGHYRDNTEWEVHYSYQDTQARVLDSMNDSETRVDFETHTAQLGGTYLFEGEKVVPYLALTLGGTYVRTRSADSENDTFFSGSIGLGLKFFPTSRVGLRLEARAYGTLISSSSRIFCSTAPDISGCSIRLNGDIAGQVETFAGVSVRF